MAYRMAPLPVPLNDFEGHFCCFKIFLAVTHCETSHKFNHIAHRVVAELMSLKWMEVETSNLMDRLIVAKHGKPPLQVAWSLGYVNH